MNVEKLASTATRTAGTVARHTFRTATWAFGLARGAAEAGVTAARQAASGDTDEARRTVRDVPEQARDTADDTRDRAEEQAEAKVAQVRDEVAQAKDEVQEKAQEKPEEKTQQDDHDDPRDHIPGPDVVAPAIPRAEDLPEPVVIEAEPAAPGEAFQTEPKAATRDSEHGGPAAD